MADKPAGGNDANPARFNVLGVGVHDLDMPRAVEAVMTAAAARRKGYVCVTGMHGVMESQKDPALRATLNASFLNVPDGMPLVWIAHAQGFRRVRRVYGPDLMSAVCEASVGRGMAHFLYGGQPGVAELLKARLEVRFPGIRIAGTFTPPFRPLTAEEEAGLASQVQAADPDFFWVGLSTPKQERFMAQYAGRLAARVFFGVGAAFDIHTGRLRDAPVWMKKAGLQWLHRLCLEPRRLWRRYLLNNPVFLAKVAAQLLGLKRYDLD